jgi:hypothetical protein
MRRRRRPELPLVYTLPVLSADQWNSSEVNAQVGLVLVKLAQTLDLEAIARRVVR